MGAAPVHEPAAAPAPLLLTRHRQLPAPAATPPPGREGGGRERGRGRAQHSTAQRSAATAPRQGRFPQLRCRRDATRTSPSLAQPRGPARAVGRRTDRNSRAAGSSPLSRLRHENACATPAPSHSRVRVLHPCRLAGSEVVSLERARGVGGGESEAQRAGRRASSRPDARGHR